VTRAGASRLVGVGGEEEWQQGDGRDGQSGDANNGGILQQALVGLLNLNCRFDGPNVALAILVNSGAELGWRWWGHLLEQHVAEWRASGE